MRRAGSGRLSMVHVGLPAHRREQMVSGMGRMNNDPVSRVIIVGAVFAGYVLLMNPLSRAIGGGALALAIVPVLAAGWFAGLWMGLTVGLVVAPVGGLVLAANDAIGGGESLLEVV